MKLMDWLQKNDVDEVVFAELIGTSDVAVKRYASGDRIPRRQVMRAIYVATCGAVSPNDFYDLPALEAGVVASQFPNGAGRSAAGA